jgi:parallel beta-helix repeat protein
MVTVMRTRPPQMIAAVVTFVILALASVVGGAPSSVAAARTWFVAASGSDGASGSNDAPLRTIKNAVDRAASGDMIVLGGGVYRESVQVYGKALHIASASGQRAVLDGARRLDGWTASGGDWFTAGWTAQFETETGGPVAPDRAVAGRPDQVFFEQIQLRQVNSRDAVIPGTFFHDAASDRVWIANDPTGRTVEASDIGWGMYFNKADGSSLTNITLRRFATERRNMAALRVYSNNVTISGVVVRDSARMGLSVIGSNIRVSDSTFNGNGYLGVHGDRLNGFVLERSSVQANNVAGFDGFHSAGGVKLTSSTGVTIRDNDVSYNDGPGIWTDIDTTTATISGNLVEHNRRAGIEIELSSDVNVLNNVAVRNGEAGIWVIESQNVQVMHNASFDNVNAIEVEEGPRRDVANVRVDNNTMGRSAAGSVALLVVNDWTEQRSAAQMGVTIAANAFWVPPTSATPAISRIGNWPQPYAFATDIAAHLASTGQHSQSVMSSAAANPYANSAATADYRWLSSAVSGTPLTAGAAGVLGVSAGARLPVGPTARSTQR